MTAGQIYAGVRAYAAGLREYTECARPVIRLWQIGDQLARVFRRQAERGRLSGSISSGVGVMADAAAATKEALKLELSEPRNGVKLPSALLAEIVTVLVDDLEVSTREGMLSLGTDVLSELLDEIEGEPTPLQLKVYLKWLSDKPDTVTTRSRSKALRAEKAKAVRTREPDVDLCRTTDDEADSDGASEFSSPDLKDTIAEERMKKTDQEISGMSPAQSTRMSMCLLVGYVVEQRLAMGLQWGDNPEVSEWWRSSVTKMKTTTIRDVIKLKDADALCNFLVKLIRSYASRGMVKELTLLSSVNTSTQQMYEGDSLGYVSYWSKVVDKYIAAGRGLPMPEYIDLYLVLQVRKGSTAQAKSLTTDVKDLTGEIKSLKSELGVGKAKMSSMESTISILGNKIRSLEVAKPGQPGTTTRDPFCHHCKQSGHWKSDCPQKKAEAEKKATEAASEE